MDGHSVNYLKNVWKYEEDLLLLSWNHNLLKTKNQEIFWFSSNVLFHRHRVQLNWNLLKKTFVPQLIDCVTLAASNLSRFTSQCNKANLLATIDDNEFLSFFAMSGSHNLQCTPDMPLAVKWNKQTLLEKRIIWSKVDLGRKRKFDQKIFDQQLDKFYKYPKIQ